MATQIVLKKEQLVKTSNGGSIREHKILGYPKEIAPLEPYSSVFYWTNIASDYGSILPEHPVLGFEILTYVIKGKYDSFSKISKKWTSLKEGDLQIIQAGKGIRCSGKLYPNSEILHIWLDPDFYANRKIDPILNQYSSGNKAGNPAIETNMEIFSSNNIPIKLQSKNASVQVIEFQAGFHEVPCPKDSVISGYVLDGFAEISNTLLGISDFFKFDGKKIMKLASLTNSKIFLLTSPYKPEYQTYGVMQT